MWVPKYRYRVLQGKVKAEVDMCVREQTRQMKCEVQELNVQAEHVHLIVQIRPKLVLEVAAIISSSLARARAIFSRMAAPSARQT